MKKVFGIWIFLLASSFLFGQMDMQYPYFPLHNNESPDWKVQFTPFFRQQASSNTFTNEFFNLINQSQYLENQMIDRQIAGMSGSSLSGQITKMGIGIKINNKNNAGKSHFNLVIENQHYLDAMLDDDMIKLLMKGNKPFAGETLKASQSSYYNIYFNQIKLGMGHKLGKGETLQQFSWLVGFNLGQNYNRIEIENSTFYTHPQGDYLDITASLKTRLSDTVWAEIYNVNGYGFSTDLEYKITIPEKFHLGLTISDLGLIFWNGNTFNGQFDTSFVFNGLSNDTTGISENLPDDFSYNNLRRMIFETSSSESFTEELPLNFRLTTGKYFIGDKLYLGMTGTYYPFLNANFDFEVFLTWNQKNKIYLTPIVSYGSYANLNIGLGVGIKIIDLIHLQIGSRYLNTMFDKDSMLGSGGYGSLTFIF
jgi:hypothetical protein